jgi:hypothetical protein
VLYRLLFFGKHRLLRLLILLIDSSSCVVFICALEIVVQAQK